MQFSDVQRGGEVNRKRAQRPQGGRKRSPPQTQRHRVKEPCRNQGRERGSSLAGAGGIVAGLGWRGVPGAKGGAEGGWKGVGRKEFNRVSTVYLPYINRISTVFLPYIGWWR